MRVVVYRDQTKVPVYGDQDGIESQEEQGGERPAGAAWRWATADATTRRRRRWPTAPYNVVTLDLIKKASQGKVDQGRSSETSVNWLAAAPTGLVAVVV